MRRAARRYGLKEAMEGEDWTLFWTDCSVSLDRVRDMKRYQVFPWSWFVFTYSNVATIPFPVLFILIELYSPMLFLVLGINKHQDFFLVCRKSTISQGWTKSAAKILWPGTWTACWSCFPKTTTSSPERGAFPQSQFLPRSFDLSSFSLS